MSLDIALEQRCQGLYLALHVVAKHRDTFGISQVSVIQKPKPQIVPDLGLPETYKAGVAVAQKAGQITNTQALF